MYHVVQRRCCCLTPSALPTSPAFGIEVAKEPSYRAATLPQRKPGMHGVVVIRVGL